jgi:hypothetical protein
VSTVRLAASPLAVWVFAACQAGTTRPLQEPRAATVVVVALAAEPAAVAATADAGSIAPEVAPAGAKASAGAAPCSGKARGVAGADGNLYLCEADGTSRPLTTGGTDMAGSLSPDGRRVAFLRAAGKERIPLGTSSIEIADNRLMLLDLAHPEGAAVEIARNDARAGCLSLASATFADDTAVIVEAHGYEQATVHNLSVCVADVPTRTLRLIGEGTRCTIFITTGRYRGDFYVSTLEIGDSGQLSFTKIVDRHGRVVRRLSGNPFVADWNGDGVIQGDETMPECLDPPPPQAALEAIMKKL